MAEDIITCPHCGESFEMAEAIRESIEEDIEKKYSKKLAKKDKDIKKIMKKMEEEKESIEERIESEIQKETKKIENETKKRLMKDMKSQIEELEEQLEEEREKTEEAEKRERELRKKERKLEKRQKKIELEVERKIDEEREKIEKEALKDYQEETTFEMMKKDKQIKELNKQITALKRTADQGSQQLQGEAFEENIQELLQNAFPEDELEVIRVGKKGADIIQRVYTKGGKYAGTILWEVKNTKDWKESWINKLKEDRKNAKAELAILVSKSLPKDFGEFGYRKNILISNYQSAIAVAMTLRKQLINISMVKRTQIGKDKKAGLLYEYLIGEEFKQNVELVAEALGGLMNDIESEKRSMKRLWKKRQNQINRAVYGFIDMYGGMQGIAGASMPEISFADWPLLPEHKEE